MKIRDVEKAFTQKLGATCDNQRDHIYFYLEYHGCEYTIGKLSHSWRSDLGDTQIGTLSHKLHLKKLQFEQFVHCTLSAEETIDIWYSHYLPR